MLKKITVGFCLMFLILSGLAVYATDSAGPADKDAKKEWKWKADDVLTGDRVNDYVMSPDAKKLVWTVTRWNLEEQKRYQVLYLSHLKNNTKKKKSSKSKDKSKGKSNEPGKIQLTRDESRYNSIQWVPGENKISFFTSRKFKKTKPRNLWIMNLDGGEPYPVTQLESGLGQYQWLDKDTILVAMREKKSLLEKETKKKKDTSVVVEDEENRVVYRLFTYNIKTKKKVRLTDNVKPVSRFWLSRDKKKVLYSVSMSVRYEVDSEIRPKFYLMTLKSGKDGERSVNKQKEILADPKLKPQGLFTWSWDSKGFFVLMHYTTHPKYDFASERTIYWYSLADHSMKRIDLDWDRYLSYARAVPGGMVAALNNGVYLKYARFTKKGDTWKREWLNGLENIYFVSFAEDGKTAICPHSNASQPFKYYLGELKKNRVTRGKEIMKIKTPLNERPLTKREIIQWKGANDDMVEGILFYPLNYEKGKKYPLLVMIHGGPHAADRDVFRDSWAYTTHLYAERGAFCLKVNYHGSAAYGLKFGESIVGHYYELEIPDIEKGVDHLIGQGKVDKDKLGIIGWSNGAILGTMLTVHTHRYKAASLGAGDVNWTSDYGNCAFGVGFDNLYFGGPPWEKVETYIKKSPLFKLHTVTTPTLIFHGTKDRAVPYEQGWEYYRALQVTGKAPVRFISFPGEGHGPRKLAHQRRKINEEIRWFEKYLFKTYKPKNKSLKKESPLAKLGTYLKISRVNGSLGVDKNGVLIPETVKFKKMEIGRYEVTRAQWAAFDKNYKVKPGTANYPVTGITFEQARQYVEWLSKQTGEAFRLPIEKEIKTLYGKRSGNTFDHWAGYALSPDDYRSLLPELAKYKNKAVLLKPAGRFAPSGENPVFDLGGNAAEWVEIKNGTGKKTALQGKACGGSAERPADKSYVVKPAAQYTGLRVVKVLVEKKLGKQ